MNLKRIIDKNGKLILYVIFIIIFILLVIKIANEIYEDEEKKKLENISNNTTINETSNDLKNNITQEEANEIKTDNIDNTMKLFVYYCNNQEISKAYNMLTDECKNAMFENEDFFNELYVKNIFNEKKDYSMVKWSTDGDRTTYLVKYIGDLLATGNEEGTVTQEYYTFVKNNDGSYKMNINNYIYGEDKNIKSEQQNIIFEIKEVDIYDSYEEYNISITNNREKEICLTGNKYNKNVYLKGKNGTTYSPYDNKFNYEIITIKPGITKNYKIKFNKVYSSSNKTASMIFSDVILDYEDYERSNDKINYNNRTSIEIKY